MSECQQFPDTWEEFEQAYGFEDKKEIYTNGSRLIQSFRVKQWLDHIAEPERKRGEWEEGEWIMHKMLSRDYGKIYYQHDCSCNLYESPYPFCPNCGMKMKRGDR